MRKKFNLGDNVYIRIQNITGESNIQGKIWRQGRIVVIGPIFIHVRVIYEVEYRYDEIRKFNCDYRKFPWQVKRWEDVYHGEE